MDNETGVFDSVEKVIAIGDLHGDYKVLLHILLDLTRVAVHTEDSDQTNCLNMKLKWNPEIRDIWLVFCGDLIDMKRNNFVEIEEDCDFQIIETLFKLQEEAIEFNSKIIILLGNHEIMNFQKNYSYIPNYVKTDERIKYRNEKFTFGSEFARKIASRTYLCVRIGNLVFIHGGFCVDFIKEINKNQLDGLVDNQIEIIPQLNKLLRDYLTFEDSEYTRKLEKLIFGGKTINIGSRIGPLWCRDHGLQRGCNQDNINNLNYITEYLNIPDYDNEKIIFVVAHTPQISNGINSICNNRLWRIDIGMSRAFEENLHFLINFDLRHIRDPARRMGVLQILTDIDTEEPTNSFSILTNKLLSRHYGLILKKDNINFMKKYTQYYRKDKKKLKESIPIIKELML